MGTPTRDLRVRLPYAPVQRVHHPNRLDHQLARAAVGWSMWADVEVDEVADRLLVLAGGNRTALERALRRFCQLDRAPVEAMLGEIETTAGRAAAALRRALAKGPWER